MSTKIDALSGWWFSSAAAKQKQVILLDQLGIPRAELGWGWGYMKARTFHFLMFL